MRKLSEHLYQQTDTCHVYVLRSGREAVLIDCGDGSVLDALPSIGIDRVTDVLMTHHHRDQGQGLHRLAMAGARIWVPHAEQELFHSVEQHWQGRELYNIYNVRQDRFSLLESVPVAGTLQDYATLSFGGFRLTVLPTPGHTIGSLSLLGEVDGRTVAFTGDLIAGPGQVWSLAATQWTYVGAEGVAQSILSLLDLRDRAPDWLLPAHGEVMRDPAAAVDLTVERLQELLAVRNQHQSLLALRAEPYVRLTPHLLRNRTSWAKSYVLLSESGKALLIDCGYDFMTGVPAGYDRASRRPWLYNLGLLKRQFGVTEIEAVILTHFHDDHVAGLNLIRAVEGAQVWAAENFAEILERPADFDLPCLWYDPIPVDRRLRLGEPVRWQEYELTPHALPGHAMNAVAIGFTVDGKRVLAIGDQQDNSGYLNNYVYANRFRPGDYVASGDLYAALQPDLLIGGHWEPHWITPEQIQTLQQRGAELERVHRALLPLASGGAGPEATELARLSPYQAEVAGGQPFALSVEVQNPFAQPAFALIRLVLPAGWRADPDPAVAEASLEPGQSAVLTFSVTPDNLVRRRARLAADLTIGDRRFGQVAEALITVRQGG